VDFYDNIMYTDQIKLTFLGDVGTGKTSIISRYSSQSFPLTILSTIGASNVIKTVNYNNQTYTLSIWDTAGQEKYKSISKMLYRDAQVVIIVFDISQHSTFLSVESWHKSVIDIAGPNVIILILGNKVDISEDMHEISKEKCENLASCLNCPLFFVSAKTGANVEEVFDEVMKMIYTCKNVVRTRTSSKLSQNQNSYSMGGIKKKGSCCSN
jgi:small GTP-binding protein